MSLPHSLYLVAARYLHPDAARELANNIAMALADGEESISDVVVAAVDKRLHHPSTYPTGWAPGEIGHGEVVELIRGLRETAVVMVALVADGEETT
jgi:hypothetical protein